VEFSADVLELLRKDDEFLLYRDKPSSVLLLAPVSDRPAPDSPAFFRFRSDGMGALPHCATAGAARWVQALHGGLRPSRGHRGRGSESFGLDRLSQIEGSYDEKRN
jgi:hypothetical protein